MHPTGKLYRQYRDGDFALASRHAAGDRSRMRSFPFRYHGQLLKITVVSVDEGWELWILDGERRLGYGGRVSVDQAIESWRRGEDCVQVLAEEVKSQVLTGRLVLDPKMPQSPLPAARATASG
jgi:hypothetical protein